MRRLLSSIDLRDVLALLGAGLVVKGLALIYVPAAYIALGLGLLALAFWRVPR